jgi:hypothetical protein
MPTIVVCLPEVALAQGPTTGLESNHIGNPSDTVTTNSTLTPTLWLPLIINGWPPPSIEFTSAPALGGTGYLRGRAHNVIPSEYRVAVYIYVWGWYNKPYWDSPLTAIRSDGRWMTNITTVETDKQATIIAAFLVPKWYVPPKLDGDPVFPDELFEKSVAYTYLERTRRTLRFSGYDWNVKYSDDLRVGPGPNYFSDAWEDVWVDENDRLHLKIVHRDGNWYATEVFTKVPFGYGKYVFYLASGVDQLDKNVVLGLFTWETVSPPGYHNREIDIEFAKWGVEGGDNAQYVVQPCGPRSFPWGLSGADSTHGFDWQPRRVYFQSFEGHQAFPVPNADAIQSWEYVGSCIPPEGVGNARINLWLTGGNPPSDGKEVEVIIERFDFLP